MDLVGTFLYILQQFGVMLGVGAATFALVFYVIANRDGHIDSSEERFIHVVYTVLRIGLFLVISSGVVITAAHMLVGETSIVTTPAYVFKWLLIGVIVCVGFSVRLRIIPPSISVPLLSASWYALFAVHILAPEASWSELLILYGVWIALVALGLFFARSRPKEVLPVTPRQILPLPSSLSPAPPRSMLSPVVPVPAKETPVINFPLT